MSVRDCSHFHSRSRVPNSFGTPPRSLKHNHKYLAQLSGGLRRRAEHLYQELHALQPLRQGVRRELIVECRKHAAAQWLQSVPYLGPIRAALLIGRVQTPHRFRTKRQFWSYCGLALETRDSGEYRVMNGQVERKRRRGFAA
jgi:transposase